MKTLGISFSIGAALQSSFANAFKTIDERSKAISKNIKGINLQKTLAINLIKTNKEFTYLKKAQERAGTASAELREKLYASALALQKAKNEAKEYGISLKNASKELGILTKRGELLSKNGLDLAKLKANRDYREQAKGQILDKIALGITIAAPFKAGIEFENAMARVKALSGATNQQFQALKETAKKLGATTVFSASQAAEAMQYLSMAGFKANDTIKAMPGLLNLAAAGQTDLAVTADIASNILTGFGINASKTTHIADVLAKAMTTSNTNIEMLGETMKYVAPAASGLGASLEEVTTLAAKLGDAGIQASNAGTALRSMYMRMASPPSEAIKIINKLGLQTKDANGKFVGMINILKQLHEVTDEMSNTEKADVMKKLFGVEAMSGAMALMQVPIDKLKSYEKALKSADGTAKKIAKEQNDTVKGSFKALSSAIEGVSISISELFLPAIKGITRGITATTQWLNSFIENHKTLATVIGGVGGGMIALSVSTFALRYAFSFLKDGFLTVKIALRSVLFWMSAEGRALAINRASMLFTGIKAKALAFWQGILAAKTKLATLWTNRHALAQKTGAIAAGIFKVAMMGVNFVLSANPIGLVVTAIGALVAGIVWAYHKFDWFKSGVNKAWEAIKKAFSFSPFGMIIKIWGKVFDWLESKFAWFGKAVNKLKSIGSGIASFLGFGDDKEKSTTIKKVAVATVTSAQLVASPSPMVSQPAVQSIKPNLRVTKPAIQSVKPQLKVSQPALQHIKPNLQVSQPAVQSIKPNLRVTKPSLQYIKPNLKVMQPNSNLEKTKTNKTIHQTNHIKIIVNNPTSNVDIEKAVTNAMANNRSLSNDNL